MHGCTMSFLFLFCPVGVDMDIRKLQLGDFTWIAREKSSLYGGINISFYYDTLRIQMFRIQTTDAFR